MDSDFPESEDRISSIPESEAYASETDRIRNEHDPSKAMRVALQLEVPPFDPTCRPPPRTGYDREAFKRGVVDHLLYTCGREPDYADTWAVYEALSYAIRDRLIHDWIETRGAFRKQQVKRIHYLSAEFLMGRTLVHNLINMGLYETATQVMDELGVPLADVLEQPSDPGLGNGGLGRLAACFLDSMTTLGYAGYGYGIRYEFGSFDQTIERGWQREHADAWLRFGNPWEILRHEFTSLVSFGGRVEQSVDDTGRARYRWVDARQVLGVPYDTLISGYGNGMANTLRLWSARASRELDLRVFNDGDYRSAVEDKILSESISKVLYPNDQSSEGKRLRLTQQYFFVACSIDDVVRRFKRYYSDFRLLPEMVAIHLNDTHPAIAVAELMRVLVDLEKLPWDTAWALTQQTLSYTNHTLLPEALERWPVSLFEELLPRHLQIIYEINHRFLLDVHVFAPNDTARQKRMSIIEEEPHKQVRMANLAVVGSHSVNGVAPLHSQLLKTHMFPDFHAMYPTRFSNKTNGITPRRWLLSANRKLAELISARIGDGWFTHLPELKGLLHYADDAATLKQLDDVKRHAKRRLVELIKVRRGLVVREDAMFVVQVKRIHEYKRQLLSALHIVHLYNLIKKNPQVEMTPRVFVFGGKAAPGYAMAKLHIKLITDIAKIVNRDPAVGDRLKVVFLANYGVSMAEVIMPAADISVQISLAGTEASGTGNMKMSLNGALTVGTYDGANLEILEAVGEENFFPFGLRLEAVEALRAEGYVPKDWIARSDNLRAAIALIESGFFSRSDHKRFAPIVDSLTHHDPYLVCADFDAYVAVQDEALAAYNDRPAWLRKALINIANMGEFSSDETIAQYANEIWHARPVSPPRAVSAVAR